MLATVMNRDAQRAHRSEAGPPRRETLDMARRSQYLALLRRWTQERLPTGTRAALDAAEWIRDALTKAAGPGGDAARENGSLLVRLRTRLLADHPSPARARLAGQSMPSSRVEQLIGCNQLDVWESALAVLPRRQRELVILRIEFGLDYAAIAAEIDLALPYARAETVNALAALIDALGTLQRDRAA
jgi:DNA-directed RNA polymerase specialized sigma24 family protein